MRYNLAVTGLRAAVLSLCAALPAAAAGAAPDLVRLRSVDASILQEMRYAGAHNFVGRPIAGYKAPECLLTREAARALADAQAELKPFGLTLKVFDCYRPQRAVDDFAAWAKDRADVRMKKEFYPAVDKADLFKDGYIAAKSGHSRGSTMDLTLAGLDGVELDMGTPFDYFDPRAHTAAPELSGAQKKNRLLLKTLLEAHGFVNLPEEWWHFTLSREPYPDRYFDAEVR
jgi:D-alanyl-D-alanine dipeptidase